MNIPFMRKKRSQSDNLKEKGIDYVKKEFGEEYVDEFVDKYDKINSGTPIGGFAETSIFLDLIETIKQQEDSK